MWRRLRRSLRMLNSQQAYDQWAVDYPPMPHNQLMEVEHRAMVALMPSLYDRVVLDVACGTGRWGQWAVAQNARCVLGLDNSPAMLRNSVLQHIALAHIESLPVATASIDVVLCGLAIGHVSHPLNTIVEIGRVLKSGGVALLSDFHPYLAWSGAKRTFKARNGETYAVEHYAHGYADWHAAASAGELRIAGVQEPRLLDKTPPVVLVMRLEK